MMRGQPPLAMTDSNMPTIDSTNTTRNQIPNTDSGTSDPDSTLPMATTKGEFLIYNLCTLCLVTV